MMVARIPWWNTNLLTFATYLFFVHSLEEMLGIVRVVSLHSEDLKNRVITASLRTPGCRDQLWGPAEFDGGWTEPHFGTAGDELGHRHLDGTSFSKLIWPAACCLQNCWGALFARSIRSVLMDCQMNQYKSDEAVVHFPGRREESLMVQFSFWSIAAA